MNFSPRKTPIVLGNTPAPRRPQIVHRFTILFLALCAAVDAGTYWVSPTGNASWPDANSDAPLDDASATSLRTASANAKAGDTVFLRAGTYDGQEIRPRNSGLSEKQRIVFSNFAKEQPVLRESEGIYILKKSYITVKGIEFRSMKAFFRIFGGNHNSIEHCLFDGRSKSATLWAGALICEDRVNRVPDPEDSTHNHVSHCKFFRWYWKGEIGDRGAIFDIGMISSKTDGSSHNLIEQNELAYGGHHCLGVFSKRNVIRNNYIHNETDPKEWDYPGYRGAITQGSAAGRNLWEGNRIGYCGQSGMGLRSPYNIVRGNYFYLNDQGGIQIVSNAQLEKNKDTADHNRIYHNTFYRNGHNERNPAFQGGIYFANWRNVSAVGNVIKNNLFFDNKGGEVTMESRVSPQIVASNWDNSRDPRFVSKRHRGPHATELPDLRLEKDSPARDQGTWLTSISSPDGEGLSFEVDDPGYFMDGWGVTDADRIRLKDSELTYRLVSVNYETKTITVDRPISFRRGQGVTLHYSGAAPDLGAHELKTLRE